MSSFESLTFFVEALRVGLRRRLRDPGFSLMLTLLVGIATGTSAAVFSVLDAAVLQAFPFPGGDRLFVVRCQSSGVAGTCPMVAEEAIRAQASSVEAVGYHSFGPYRVGRAGRDALIAGTRSVSTNFFSTLGLPPIAGRWFDETDNISRRAVVIISSAMRDRLFGQDEDPIGEVISLNELPHTIVGVMPSRFAYPDSKTSAWVADPRTISRIEGHTGAEVSLFVRTRLRLSERQLETELNATVRPLYRSVDKGGGLTIAVRTMESSVLGFDARLLWAIFAGTLCLVSVVCVDVAGLVIARTQRIAARQAMQLALGAGRWHLRVEVFLEFVPLVLPSVLLGLGTASLMLSAFRNLGALGVSRAELASVGMRTVAVSVGAAFVVCVIAGVVAAISAEVLSGSAGPGSARVTNTRVFGTRLWPWQQGAVTLQLAVSVALAIVSAAAGHLLIRVWTRPIGYNPTNLYSAFLDQPRGLSLSATLASQAEISQALSSLPGVTGVAISTAAPATGGVTVFLLPYELADGTWRFAENVAMKVVSSNYFDVIGAPMLGGRSFNDADVNGGECVAIVSRALATRIAGVGSALGRRISPIGSKRGYDRETCRVVGVVDNVRQSGLLKTDIDPEVYYSTKQRTSPSRVVVIRTAAVSTIEPVRSLLADRFGGRSKVALIDASENLAKSTQTDRLFAYIIIVFACGAVLVAFTGVVASALTQTFDRRQEFTLRLILGAGRVDLALEMLRGVAIVAILGVTIGGLAARSTASVYQSWNANLPPVGTAGHLLVAGLAIALVLLVSWIPLLTFREGKLLAQMRRDS